MSLLAGPSRLLLRSTATKDVCLCIPVNTILKRKIHKRPNLHFDPKAGVEPFLSGKALDTIAEYQDGLLIRLNDAVRGTPWETSSVVQTVISTAPDRNHAMTFNYASEALNTSYFLSKLTTSKTQSNVTASASRLKKDIEAYFGSVTQFQHAFSSSALGMSGSGYMWFVMDNKGRLGIVGTYGSGTVLVQGRQQRGEYSDLAQDVSEKEEAPVTPSLHEESITKPAPLQTSDHRPSLSPSTPSTSRSFSSTPSIALDGIFERLNQPTPTPPKSKQIDREIYPLFCVSMHEHCWMPDYGVWGQEAYLANFWKVLDWQNVGLIYERLRPAGMLERDQRASYGRLGLGDGL